MDRGMRRFRVACQVVTAALGMAVSAAAQGGGGGLAAPAHASDAERARVAAIVAKMSLADKISLIAGNSMFGTRALSQYGIPSFRMSDGPVGARVPPPSTAFAGGIGLAATWDPAMAYALGVQLARDTRSRGANYILGPGVNIYKMPNNGRNFEYFGEDPFLAGRTAVGYVEGVQSEGVSATIKHYDANNSEFARHTMNSVVDERTLREIYLPVFEAAVKEAHVGAVMDSYNLINGQHATENSFLNRDVLRRDWGFDGVLMSDWFATYDGVKAANGGMDLEMPFGLFMNEDVLLPAVKAGTVSEATINEKVTHILELAARFGWLDRPALDTSVPRFNRLGAEAARKGAEEGMVLLKNEGGALPLDPARVKRVAVIGPDAFPAVATAGGSGQVASFDDVSFLTGVSRALDGKATVTYAKGVPSLARIAAMTVFHPQHGSTATGVTVETFAGTSTEGKAVSTRTEGSMSAGHANLGDPEFLEMINDATKEQIMQVLNVPPPSRTRYTGYVMTEGAEPYTLMVEDTGHYRLLLDGKVMFDHVRVAKSSVADVQVTLAAGEHEVQMEDMGAADFGASFFRVGLVKSSSLVDAAAVRLAREADAVVVAVGYQAETESEGADRSFDLPPGQAALIEQVAAVNKKVIVVVTSGGSVATAGWLGQVPALVEAWYPGQEGGTAFAKLLLGEVNPSGHLPISWEKRAEDNPSIGSYYYNGSKPDDVVYKEGVFVGYRGYQHTGVEPLFPFGFGMSYTTFAFRDLKVAAGGEPGRYQVSFRVKNTGAVAGATVGQVYVAPPKGAVERPVRELRGFARVTLQPGEERTLTVDLGPRAFTFYDVAGKQWRAEAGSYGVEVGDSSAHLPLHGAAELKAPLLVPVTAPLAVATMQR